MATSVKLNMIGIFVAQQISINVTNLGQLTTLTNGSQYRQSAVFYPYKRPPMNIHMLSSRAISKLALAVVIALNVAGAGNRVTNSSGSPTLSWQDVETENKNHCLLK